MATKKKTDEEVDGAVTEPVETDAAVTPAEETAAVEVKAEAAPAEEKPKKTRSAAARTEKVEKKTDEPGSADKKKGGKRAERIGVVSSDKMTKTVVVRVDRLVKHPVYRKYVRKRKKFMAHDELGAKIGDKVKIVETRPLSARKRWRVVEIIQKAEL
jgi:small subunit ribosomal protein S17